MSLVGPRREVAFDLKLSLRFVGSLIGYLMVKGLGERSRMAHKTELELERQTVSAYGWAVRDGAGRRWRNGPGAGIATSRIRCMPGGCFLLGWRNTIFLRFDSTLALRENRFAGAPRAIRQVVAQDRSSAVSNFESLFALTTA